MAAAFCRSVSWVVSPPWSSSRLSLRCSAHGPLPLARGYSTSYTKTRRRRRSKSYYSSPGERRKVVIKCLSNESETEAEAEAEFELQRRLFSNLNQTTLKREPGQSVSRRHCSIIIRIKYHHF